MLNINKQLYDYLINNLGAYYEQNTERVQSNINNTPDDNKWYLGTYFPKSFKESYIIFNDIITEMQKYDYFNFKDEINILDLGSGTGGQIFGFIQALHDNIDNNLTINIYSVDGNKNSLNIQKNIFDNYWEQNFKKHNINITFYCKIFNNGDDIDNFLSEKISSNSIDIILSFKFLSELLKYDNFIYTKTLKACENILKDNGILVLDDVTITIDTLLFPETDIIYKRYIPYSINENIKEYLNKEHSLNLLLPLCCFYNANQCKKSDCYEQCSIYSNMIIDNNTNHSRQIECKIIYNLFIKNGNIYKKIHSFLQHMNEICINFCVFKNNRKTCYCNCNNKFKEYFSSTNFDNSQFSLAKLNDLYNEYIKKD